MMWKCVSFSSMSARYFSVTSTSVICYMSYSKQRKQRMFIACQISTQLICSTRNITLVIFLFLFISIFLSIYLFIPKLDKTFSLPNCHLICVENCWMKKCLSGQKPTDPYFHFLAHTCYFTFLLSVNWVCL